MPAVAVIGGGIVGAATAFTLARRSVETVLLEADGELARGASGTNSGIVHTGFDSKPGELETELILRAAALRDPVLDDLGLPVDRCGALLRARTPAEAETLQALADNADANGVEVIEREGELEVPGEAITDPVAFTRALAAAAEAGGAQVLTGARVDELRREGKRVVVGVAGERFDCEVAVNCAGLYADEVARLAGDESFAIHPRKGEFFVFDRSLDRILLPIPTARTKGVLVFPTLDGKVIAGPTAHDQHDKSDWSVRPEAFAEVMPKALAMLPELEGAEPIASYAGLRPAGRNGVNYRIGWSPDMRGLFNVAAIRSTGLTASLGIAEYVVERVGEQVKLGPDRTLAPASDGWRSKGPWWRR